MEQSPSWEANNHSDTQEIPPFYGTRKFIKLITTAHAYPEQDVTEALCNIS
jgi:hypothetical protein